MIIYFSISFIVLVVGFLVMNYYDKYYEVLDGYSIDYKDAYILANFLVLIPLTYLVAFGFLLVKYKEYLNHKKRYLSFFEYSEEQQKEILANNYCSNCQGYQNTSFNSEEMIDGMRWLKLKCNNCSGEVKKRLS